MSCGWEGNRRSGVALAMRHRLKWFTDLRAHGLERKMSTPPRLSQRSHLPTSYGEGVGPIAPPHPYGSANYTDWMVGQWSPGWAIVSTCDKRIPTGTTTVDVDARPMTMSFLINKLTTVTLPMTTTTVCVVWWIYRQFCFSQRLYKIGSLKTQVFRFCKTGNNLKSPFFRFKFFLVFIV